MSSHRDMVSKMLNETICPACGEHVSRRGLRNHMKGAICALNTIARQEKIEEKIQEDKRQEQEIERQRIFQIKQKDDILFQMREQIILLKSQLFKKNEMVTKLNTQLIEMSNQNVLLEQKNQTFETTLNQIFTDFKEEENPTFEKLKKKTGTREFIDEQGRLCLLVFEEGLMALPHMNSMSPPSIINGLRQVVYVFDNDRNVLFMDTDIKPNMPDNNIESARNLAWAPLFKNGTLQHVCGWPRPGPNAKYPFRGMETPKTLPRLYISYQ